jgi:chaperone modulatory protein CbpM
MASTASITTTTLVTTVCLGEDAWLALPELARACQAPPGYIEQLVDEGLLQPVHTAPAWRFGGDELARVRRIQRLQADFEASLPSVGLMLDLLDEIDRLRGQLQRLGPSG